MGNYNYFSEKEVEGLDKELCCKLDQARHRAGVPFVITSGLRTPETNTDPNAAQDSAHLKGLAVDLRCHDSRTLWKMLEALFVVGFKRLGVYFKVQGGKATVTHVHVDTDLTKPAEVLWLTVEK